MYCCGEVNDASRMNTTWVDISVLSVMCVLFCLYLVPARVPGLPINLRSNVWIHITGCKEDGECKPVGSVWRRPGECAKFKCVMGDCDDGSIETDIEEFVGKFVIDNTGIVMSLLQKYEWVCKIEISFFGESEGYIEDAVWIYVMIIVLLCGEVTMCYCIEKYQCVNS